MKQSKKYVGYLAIITFLVMTISFSYAQVITAEKPTLLETIKNLFSQNEFTIVGQDIGASTYPDQTFDNIAPGTGFTKSASDYCDSGYGLFDVFVNNYIPRFEMRNTVSFSCGSGNEKCIVELYCMPRDFCFSNNDCPSGYDCISKSAIDPYIPLKDSSGNTITSYKYCKESEGCTGSPISCYRVGSSNTCEVRTYACDYSTYPNCPSTYPYTSLQSCQNDIDTSCNPDCSCASNTCEGDTCSNGCGGTCQGTKDCGGGTTTTGSGDIVLVDVDFPEKASSFLWYKFGDEIKVTIKNYGDKQETIKLEGGFYTPSYAKNVAQLYAIATAELTPNCNPLETFIQTYKITLDAGESKQVTLNPNPLAVFILYDVGTYETKDTDLIAFVGLYKECLGGYINDAGSVGKGVMFDYANYELPKYQICPPGLEFELRASDGDVVGTCENNILIITEKIDVPSTELIQSGSIEECSLNSDCEDGQVCEEGYCLNKFIDESARQIGIDASELNSFTINDLLASTCTETRQCQSGSSCKSIYYLKEKNYISDNKGSELLQKTSTAFLGAGTGIASCVAGASVLSLSTAGIGTVLFPLCAVGGGAVSLGIQDIFDNFKEKNEQKAGYCIIEGTDEGKFNDFIKSLAFFSITGNEFTDGLIIFMGGLFLVVLLMTRM